MLIQYNNFLYATRTEQMMHKLYNLFTGHKINVALARAQDDEHCIKTLNRVSETTNTTQGYDDLVATGTR